MSATATLRNSKYGCWRVELKEVAGKMYFERGWTKFVDENTTMYNGDILGFTYVGSSLFDVTIMGPNGCMKSVWSSSLVEGLEEEEKEDELLPRMTKERPLKRLKMWSFI
ncbi:hypothetical protein COLO4_28211 [Corchorus olitorius]|uniref:TF-B3 domain-containing protein n=1 Tax=Corchorus olitorius TaxID=93759 RepID=A0A1R3HMG3_9ROSI|nr:hypothetical protein COLO4_28211 [Corchorus olitorius]